MAGAGANDASFGGVAWTDPGKITSDNTDYATVELRNSTSNYLVSSAHGFTIPVGATIDGIVANVNRYSNTANQTFDERVRIVKGGVVGATDRSAGGFWSTTGSDVVTYGGVSDLWGESWLYSDINASNFGLAIACRESGGTQTDGLVDYVELTVWYTPGGQPYVKRMGGVRFGRRSEHAGLGGYWKWPRQPDCETTRYLTRSTALPGELWRPSSMPTATQSVRLRPIARLARTATPSLIAPTNSPRLPPRRVWATSY
jgi:hypothetical protein